MTNSRDILLKLVRVAMSWEGDYTLPKDIDWTEVLHLADEQGVTPIALDGYDIICQKNPQGARFLSATEDKALILQHIGHITFTEHNYRRHISTLVELGKVLENKHIPFLLMKGLSCGLHYPNPRHRPCGDIDIYPGELYNESNEALKDAGIGVVPDYYRHSVSYINDVMIENHCVLCDLRGPKRQTREFEALLESEAKKSITENTNLVLDGIKIPGAKKPSANFNALFLPWHVSAHLAFERVTIRHLLDWALFLTHEGKDIDVEMYRAAKKRFTYGYSKLADILTALSLEYLKMPADDIPQGIIEDAANTTTELNTKVLDYIFSGQLRERDNRVWKFRINNVKKVWIERWKYKELFKMNVFLFLFYKIKGVILHEGE